MIKLVLALFDRLAWLLGRLGVDYDQFRAILQAKLTIDSRVRGAAFQAARARPRSPANAFVWTLFFNALMGLFVALLIPVAGSPLVGLTIVHSFVMLMVAMALIADFSTVLLEETDARILQPRPVSSRTVVMARLAHIVTYLALITLSLAAGSFVAGALTHGGLFVPLFGATLVAAVVLVVGLVAVLYLVLMRLISQEKLRDLITYAQIAMTVIVVAGYQVLPRMMDMRQLREARIEADRWIYCYPPAWLAGAVDLGLGAHRPPQLLLSGLAVAVPLLVLLAVVWLAPAFRISAGAGSGRTQGRRAAAARRAPPASLGALLARLLVRRGEQRAAFGFLWRLSRRDRQFQRRTYPSFAFVFLFAGIYIFSDAQDALQTLATLHETKKHLLLLYFAGLMLPTALINMRFSEQPEAAWIYGAAPLACPGVLLAAGLKVLVLQLLVPIYLLLTCLTLALWGPRVLPDIALAFANLLVVATLYGLFLARALPFAQPYGVMEGSGRLTRSLILFLGPLTFGGVHYALTFTPLGVVLAIPLALALYHLLSRRYARTSWSRLSAG